MLTQLRCPIRLTFGSTDFLLAAETETVGTLYQIEQDRFHLVMTEPLVIESHDLFTVPDTAIALANIPTPRLLCREMASSATAICLNPVCLALVATGCRMTR
jgi:hypothetical protein